MHRWAGDVFYRGIDPSSKGYAELRYWGEWHSVIADKEWALTHPSGT